MSEFNGILTFAETVNGKATAVTKELLGAGRKLADDLGQELGALAVGEGADNASQELIALGADIVYLVSEPALSEQHPDLLAAVISEACRQVTPLVTLLGYTDLGRDAGPRVAGLLDWSVTTDCVGIDIGQDKGSVLITRPVYGGKALAQFASGINTPQIVLVRPHSMPPADADTSRQGKTSQLGLSVDGSLARSKLVQTVKEEFKGIRLEEAEVVVAGGMGIGGNQGFELLQEMANVLKGAVGATRAPCDEGWVSPTLKIGQTGKIVNPKLYIAVGVSGAAQHITGILGSKCIVAINKDAEANIFRVSDLGIVADYREAVPALIEELKKI